MITGGDKIARILQLGGPQIRANLINELAIQGFDLAQYVKVEKLSGQVLHVRTDTLRGSIRNDAVGDGMTQAIGTNVPYGRFWELGFQGEESVAAHLRQLKSGTIAHVRAYVRQLNILPRSFLRTSLEENKAKIRAALIGNVRATLQEMAA